MVSRRLFLQSSAASAAYLASGLWPARAANAPGVTDTEIKIGQTMPYSGPLSAYGVVGRTEAAYFEMINEQGGVNGRKLNLISLDDGFSPPRPSSKPSVSSSKNRSPSFSGVSARRPMRRSAPISTTTRCRNCSSPPAPRCSAIRNTIRGRWATSRTIRQRRTSSPSIFSRPSPRRKSACSTKMTGSARTI